MVGTIDEAAALVTTICRLPGNDRFIQDTHQVAKAAGLREAVKARDTPALFDWLMTSFSFQGISDRIAWEDYIEAHGNATWSVIEKALDDHRCRCPKLAGFETYQNCGYRKTASTCRNPSDLPDCPVPSLPLRKGDLNQLAFSLFFFLRDQCRGDLVGFIDGIFAEVDATVPTDPLAAKREALIAAFSQVHAISTKLIAMTFAPLLMAGDPRRLDWIKVGRSLVAVDSLVHNFLHRTGILAAFGRQHPYGARCYRPDGCTGVIQELAARIDARQISPRFPRTFPRLVQFAIWSFCAETRTNFCNGRQIDDRFPCTRLDCPVESTCARLPLRPPQLEEFGHARAVRLARSQSHPLPFQQGHLDGLCGLYALINAIRLATSDHLDLTNDQWTGIFACLLTEADAHTGATNLVMGGIGTRRLIALARYAVKHMANHHGIRLEMSRPLINLAKPSQRKLVAELRRLVGRPASAILIGIGGSLDHWSVVRSVGDHYLGLFDSSSCQRIQIDRCRARHEKNLRTVVQHVLHPDWIIRLTVAD